MFRNFIYLNMYVPFRLYVCHVCAVPWSRKWEVDPSTALKAVWTTQCAAGNPAGSSAKTTVLLTTELLSGPSRICVSSAQCWVLLNSASSSHCAMAQLPVCPGFSPLPKTMVIYKTAFFTILKSSLFCLFLLGIHKGLGWTVLESPTQSPTQRPTMTLLHRVLKNPHL